MKTSRSMRIFLLAVASSLVVVLSYLGVETCSTNLLGLFLILVGIGYLSGGVIYFLFNKDRNGATREETVDWSFWLILPGFLVVFFVPPLEYLYLRDWLPRSSGMQVAGLIMIGLGLLLRVWTRLALREHYTGHVQIREDHRLVQEGPYHYVRHPGYAGFLLFGLGLAIGYSSLIGILAIPVLLLPGLVYRMSVEKRLLTEQFGNEFRQYAAKTKRLLPGVW